MSGPPLRVTLESELPSELAVGRGTALFVCGWCYCPEAPVAALEFVVDERSEPVMAAGMPRLDPFRALHPGLDPFATAGVEHDPDSVSDPGLHSYRSGFWGVVPIRGPRVTGPVELKLRARLRDGREAVAELGRISVTPAPAPSAPSARAARAAPATLAAGSRQATVAICMATYDPPAELLRRQLDSIRTQTHSNWICLISDDCSSPAGRRVLEEAVAGDDRFVISRSPRRLGFYANFERALGMVPAEAELVALADQDDSWHPDKLATLVAALGRCQLVYSDARVVSRAGELISDTWWSRRRNNHSDLLSLLVANAVTGAASLFRPELLDSALPFPPAQFAHFHDHWLGLVACALGDIEYVARPLYDYVQHGDASLGHAGANQMPSLRERVRGRREPAERVRLWRLHYFVDYCRLVQFATVLKLRCGPRMTGGKRRELDRFLTAADSPVSLVRFALRGGRELAGTPETLGAEWMLLHALVWRRLVALTARDRPQTRLRLDALPPPTLVAPPGRRGLEPSANAVAEKIAPLPWMRSETAPSRINVLIPTLELRHLFAGYIAKFNLARRLALLGHRVRLVTVDPVGPLAHDYRGQVESYSGLAGLFDHVEVTFGRESAQIEISETDRFVATTWWTAHIARQATAIAGGARFGYLIQEYEPFTFPMGSYAALAADSYRSEHFALFSSELLRDYFRRHRIGVYARGEPAGDAGSASFQNAITAIPPPSPQALRRAGPRRVLFYARPEPHAARNMFELGTLALSHAVAEGAFAGWELHGIGTVGRGRDIPLGAGASLTLLPRRDQAAYARVLGEHDVGLALMYTPHPSLVPIEMASAGMLAVTNSFENKTAEALAAISPNLIVAEPSLPAIVTALGQAAAGAQDAERRAHGSHVNWSSDWSRSLDDALLGRLIDALAPAGSAAR